MSWDPITRIVGSLGIHTKIDFANRRVAECYSTSSIFRGYSVFMKGKDPRDAHLITSRICGICGDNHATCACYAQNMAFGVRPPALAEWIINLGEAAEYMFDHNLYQDNLVGVDFCEQMVRETNPGVLERAERTEAPHAGLHGYRTIADIMRSLNPFTGRLLPRGAPDEPADPRDVLPDGGAARPPLDPLPGRRRHGAQRPALHRLPGAAAEVRRVHEEGRPPARRPLRLLLRGPARLRGGRPPPGDAGLLGLVQRPRGLRLHLSADVGLGPGDVRHPRDRDRRRADHDRPGGDQPRPAHPARQLVLRRLAGRRDVRQGRPAGQPDRPAAPLEPDHAWRSGRSATSRASIPG